MKNISILVLLLIYSIFIPQISVNAETNINIELPILKNPHLEIEEFVSGLNFPTDFDFIGNDIFVLEKDGNVRFIKDGVLLDKPIKSINVSTSLEDGLLGILVKDKSVYLHYTTLDDKSNSNSNWYYKFLWNGTDLTQPQLLFQIHNGSFGHNSGVMENYQNNVIMILGDLFNRNGINQNNFDGEQDNTSVILPIDPLGEPIAIGIRNSYGLGIDPITKLLWDTENGPDYFDEINLIQDKFNSGWNIVQGPSSESQRNLLKNNSGYFYSDPKFSWERPIGVTDIHFFNPEFFPELRNYVMVGAFHNGNLYWFNLNPERDGFIFETKSLQDNILNLDDDDSEIILGTGFHGITTIKEGPDGKLYLISIGNGKIYRISYESGSFEVLNENECLQRINEKVLKNCNFSNMNLSNYDLSNKDISFSNFSNSLISNSKFSNSIIVNSIFINSTINNSNFSNSNLESSTLTNSNIENTDFINTNLKSTNFKNSTINNSNFSNSNMEYSLLSNTGISDSIFINTHLYYSSLSNSKLSNSNFKNSDMSFARLNNNNIDRSDFSDTRLWKSQFNNSTFTKIEFLASDNYYSQFQNSKFYSTNFENSRFSNVNLSNSDLVDSSLKNIYPMDSIYENMKIDNLTNINTCLGSDLISKIFNKMFRVTNINQIQSLEYLTKFFINICN